MTQSHPRTLYEKIWDAHLVEALSDTLALIYVDLHLLNEVMSAQAFEGLRERNRPVRRPDRTLAVSDHNVPTDGDRSQPIADPESRLQVETLERHAAEFGIPYIPLASDDQGIVHVIGPELGLTVPGSVIVCGDSHTSTHGAFGALAFGIGTSEVEHVLATQCLTQRRSKTMLVRVSGSLREGVSAKDLILTIIARLGTNGATGHVIEYAGEAIRALDMASRMTVCNMSIEAGARAGLIAPDETTFAYLAGRRHAPKGAEWEAALADWRMMRSDPEAEFDAVVEIDANEVVPMTTWGTSPETAIPLKGAIPAAVDQHEVNQSKVMLDYMGLEPGQSLSALPIDVVFIGSCTNGRIEDLRAAADVIAGRNVAPGVRAMVVPGSGQVKRAAEAEGLDRIFIDAGFEWRDAGCSMCLGMNPDQLGPGQRCVSTSNRNFQGRQGPGGRTHLVSPRSAAASAIAGHLASAEFLK
ncbi:MAG: 3-isopropylmalate dehydratase large subunit [Sphingobium sp.]|nr:3-isopropylmalate dehydratase large subunit [Sphingobium sp.]